MAVVSQPESAESPEQVELAEPPRLAPNVQLVGMLPDAAFVDQQWLIQRDGDFVQLTELLYRILEQIDGERTLDEIAAGATYSTKWIVSGDQVGQLITSKLMPLGIVAGPDGTITPRAAGTSSGLTPLDVNMRVKVIGPRVIEPVTGILQYLFFPPIVVAVLLGAVAAHLWLYRERGLLGAFLDALYTPGVLLILLGVVLASALFHEFGHASALRYGGGHARRMGAGFYAVFPVFFTDATDSYRLGRWARVRTGLGGVYFHVIFSLAIMGVALATGNEFLLLAVLLINLEIVHQFIPFLRLDGYWILTDLTGVPDFFSQVGPFLRSLLPARVKAAGTKLPALKPWAKGVFVVYIALTIPALAVLLFMLIRRLPAIVTGAWDAILTNAQIAQYSAGDGDYLTLATAVTQILVLMLPVLGIAYLLYTLTWRPLKAAWRQPTPVRRFSGVIAMAIVVGGVAFFWAPRLPFAAQTSPAGVKTYKVNGNQHVRGPVSYPQSPPVGGNHDPVPQDCGFYPAPVSNEHAVHSLEHGAVWITYHPELARNQVDSLRSLAEREDRVIVSPYPGLSRPVVASSWGRQLPVDSVSDARIDRFVDAFRNDSKAPEAGGPCSGGRSTP
jgi:putative peptide zinc metalloprotease protein